MADTVLEGTIIETYEVPQVDVSRLVTEDDTPVDNIFSERQMRLLTTSLYASWKGVEKERPFIALANVGLYYSIHEEALVPDVLVSLDVQLPDNVMEKAHCAYLLWEYGKPPDIVVEIVSNKKGREDSYKLSQYARMGVPYYVIYDPEKWLSREPLRVYELHTGVYRQAKKAWFARVGLGVTVWEGVYEGTESPWLRWCDQEGNILLTGEERAERLAAQLRAMGIEPEV